MCIDFFGKSDFFSKPSFNGEKIHVSRIDYEQMDWNRIESNQIAIQHNRSHDKLPVRNFKVEKSEQVSLGISQIYPGLSTFGSNVWVVREKKTDNRFYIVRP